MSTFEVAVHMNAYRAGIVLSVLMVMHFSEIQGTADGLPSVRVVAAGASVFERPDTGSHVITVAQVGAVLDLIDKREGWYWVLSARDQNGSRQAGWIQTSHVAIATPPSSLGSLRTLNEEFGALPPPALESRQVGRKARQEARKIADEARAKARIEQASQNLEEARRTYEELITTKRDEAPVP